MRILILDEDFNNNVNARDYSIEYSLVAQKENGKDKWADEESLLMNVENKAESVAFFVPNGTDTYIKVTMPAAHIKKLYKEIELLEAKEREPVFWD